MFIITYRKLFLMIGALIVLTAATIVFTLGLKPGIDFTGGALTEVQYQTLPEKSAIESVLSENGLENSAIRQSAGELGTSYIITTRTLSVEEQKNIETKLLEIAPDSKIIRTTSVGPVIGAELADKAYYALFAVSLMIIIYVAIAFVGIGTPVSSWVYGAMTVLVLVHDILVPVAVMSLLGYLAGLEVDVLFVTALLTILGYSVNDTIVIFDRVREKLQQNRTEHKKVVKRVGEMDRTEVTYTLNKPFDELVGQAVDETMVRSVNTSLTVLFALLALYFFGSVVTQTFALVLIAGVIAGAYSSIFIASPLLVAYAEYQAKRESK
ncbi:protein translocase subunit SecF [Patescibacteria group bacterium]|nr:protein translocase subunit SecF [Patescibacteria group bacterium]